MHGADGKLAPLVLGRLVDTVFGGAFILNLELDVFEPSRKSEAETVR